MERQPRRNLIAAQDSEAETIEKALQLCAKNLDSCCRQCPFRGKYDEMRNMGCCDLLMAKASELIRMTCCPAARRTETRLISLEEAAAAPSCWIQVNRSRSLILTQFLDESDHWVDFWETYTFPKKTFGVDWRIWNYRPKMWQTRTPWRTL